MDDNTKSTNFVVDVYGYIRTPNNPNSYSSEIIYSDTRTSVPLVDGICPSEGSDWISDIGKYNKNGCYAYWFKDNFGYHTPPPNNVYENPF